jgi:transcriptional regulator with GAF, ATPase, and Fis domain
VLQERTIERLGSHHSIKVDVRIIAATNRDLEEAMRNNAFREDLFYRLNVFPITIPPLRERVEDIPDLARAFVEELSCAFGKKVESIAPESLKDLQQYSWPGNVRELRNVIERAVIVARTSTLTPTVPRTGPLAANASRRLLDIQARHIKSVLAGCHWRVRGLYGAAEQLGMKPTTLEAHMARLGIRRDSIRP